MRFILNCTCLKRIVDQTDAVLRSICVSRIIQTRCSLLHDSLHKEARQNSHSLQCIQIESMVVSLGNDFNAFL